MLPFDGQTPGLRGWLDELDLWREQLDLKGPLPRTWLGRLRRELQTQATASSVIMEGVPVTPDDVRRILAGESPPEVAAENQALVSGYHQAMGYVLRRADDPGLRWERELILAVHDRVLAGRFTWEAGRLRTIQVRVARVPSGETVFMPPPAQEVPGLVDELCARAQAATWHPAALAAWVHVALAAIHPFRDGNGRTARILATLAMARGGFKRPEFTSLEEWWGRHLATYYEAFGCLGQRFHPEADVTPFVRVHVEGQLEQVRELDLRERVERKVWLALEELVAEAGLPPRTAEALWDAFLAREITPAYYRAVVDVSPASARVDLRALTAARLLRPMGGGPSRRYLAGERLTDLLAERLGIEVWGEPEERREAILAELARRLRAERRLGERLGVWR